MREIRFFDSIGIRSPRLAAAFYLLLGPESMGDHQEFGYTTSALAWLARISFDLVRRRLGPRFQQTTSSCAMCRASVRMARYRTCKIPCGGLG